MSETKTYTGGCHCGKVRFSVDLDLATVYACNCSICSKMGWRLAFAPESAFRLEKGEEALSDYQFGKKHIHHYFCRECGIRSFGRGHDGKGKHMISINVRCLDDVGERADELPVQRFDGKNL
ncbi:MAG: GFA family protein [Polyangiales bacterium]